MKAKKPSRFDNLATPSELEALASELSSNKFVGVASKFKKLDQSHQQNLLDLLRIGKTVHLINGNQMEDLAKQVPHISSNKMKIGFENFVQQRLAETFQLGKHPWLLSSTSTSKSDIAKEFQSAIQVACLGKGIEPLQSLCLVATNLKNSELRQQCAEQLESCWQNQNLIKNYGALQSSVLSLAASKLFLKAGLVEISVLVCVEAAQTLFNMFGFTHNLAVQHAQHLTLALSQCEDISEQNAIALSDLYTHLSLDCYQTDLALQVLQVQQIWRNLLHMVSIRLQPNSDLLQTIENIFAHDSSIPVSTPPSVELAILGLEHCYNESLQIEARNQFLSGLDSILSSRLSDTQLDALSMIDRSQSEKSHVTVSIILKCLLLEKFEHAGSLLSSFLNGVRFDRFSEIIQGAILRASSQYLSILLQEEQIAPSTKLIIALAFLRNGGRDYYVCQRRYGVSLDDLDLLLKIFRSAKWLPKVANIELILRLAALGYLRNSPAIKNRRLWQLGYLLIASHFKNSKLVQQHFNHWLNNLLIHVATRMRLFFVPGFLAVIHLVSITSRVIK